MNDAIRIMINHVIDEAIHSEENHTGNEKIWWNGRKTGLQQAEKFLNENEPELITDAIEHAKAMMAEEQKNNPAQYAYWTGKFSGLTIVEYWITQNDADDNTPF